MKSGHSFHQFEAVTTRAIRVQYLLFLPSGYPARPPSRSAGYPLILFLHGAGERGTVLARVAAHGVPRVAPRRPDFPFIVLSPLCPAGEHWSPGILMPLLEHIQQQYQVDPKRVYLTGLSMGGYGTWDLALTQPERFAAIAPVCGGGTILPILLSDRKRERALKSLGVWAFHGAKDPVVPLQESERMVGAFRELGNPAKLTVYPDAGHDCWTETYANPALYKWLLGHSRRFRSTVRPRP